MKLLACFLIISASILSGNQTLANIEEPDTATYIHYIIRTDSLYLRNKPDAMAKNLMVLKRGDTIEILDADVKREWVKISNFKMKGFIPSKYIQKVVSTPVNRYSSKTVTKVNETLYWKNRTFWIIVGSLLLLSITLTIIGNKYDRNLFYDKEDFYIRTFTFRITTIAIACILGIFYVAWDQEVIEYLRYDFGFIPKFKRLISIRSIIWLSFIILTIQSVRYIYKYLNEFSFKTGILRWLYLLLENSAWFATFVIAVIGLLIPSLIVFGIGALIYGLLSPGGGESYSSGPNENKDAKMRKHFEKMNEAERSKNFERERFEKWQKGYRE